MIVSKKKERLKTNIKLTKLDPISAKEVDTSNSILIIRKINCPDNPEEVPLEKSISKLNITKRSPPPQTKSLLSSFRVNKFKSTNVLSNTIATTKVENVIINNSKLSGSKNLILSSKIRLPSESNKDNKKITKQITNIKEEEKNASSESNSPSKPSTILPSIRRVKEKESKKENTLNNISTINPKKQTNNINPTNNVIKSTPKFDILFNSSTREESQDRFNSVRKIFREKKLHIFNKSEKLFYYVILPGNSSYLVKNCMTHRTNWRECQSNITTLFNFKWQQNNIGIDFASLSNVSSIKQMVNHFEFHPVISNKCNLFINMLKYCEGKGLEVFNYIPFTILMQYDSSSYSLGMESFHQIYSNIKDYVTDIDQLIRNRELIASDTRNCFYVNKSQSQGGNNSKIKKYAALFSLFLGHDKLGIKTTAAIPPSHYDGKNLWIVKACDLNRGRCIKLGDSFSGIQKLVKKFYEGISKEYSNEEDEETNLGKNSNSNGVNNSNNNLSKNLNSNGANSNTNQNSNNANNSNTNSNNVNNANNLNSNNAITNEEKKNSLLKKYRTNSVIIQKYIEKPLLYRGRKFDIRIWVMLTHKSLVYVFKEGHLKTSSEIYDINITNSYIHLTNYSVQKYNGNFAKYEEGNEVPFSDFEIFLKEFHPDKTIEKNIWPKIKEIIDISFRSVISKINSNNNKFCFEIFGYDFILDENFEVFLLEVNTNPGLEESSPVIKMLVPRMLDDALRLTVDEVFETKFSFNEDGIQNDETDKNKVMDYISPFDVKGYSKSENLWSLVVDLNEKDAREKSNYSSVKKRKK